MRSWAAAGATTTAASTTIRATRAMRDRSEASLATRRFPIREDASRASPLLGPPGGDRASRCAARALLRPRVRLRVHAGHVVAFTSTDVDGTRPRALDPHRD